MKNIRFIFFILIILGLTGESCVKKQVEQQDNISDSIVETINADISSIEIIEKKTSLEQLLDNLGLVEIKNHDSSILIDLKYASTDNFTGKLLYKDLNRAYLHPAAMAKLSQAQNLLKTRYPNYTLLIYDAARPLSIQQKMYDEVKNTPYKAYVADPSRTSLHNYGLAVDLTICDENNKHLDMGTEFDFFGAKAGINNEEHLVAQGKLTTQQVSNRRILRGIMEEAGFMPIRGEWWHFNACSLSEAKKYPLLK